MPTKNLAIALVTTFVAFCSLYLPQPLLPLLSTEFKTTPGTTALLVSAPMLLLGIAPIFFGYILQALSTRILLRVALPLLAVSNLTVLFVEEFWQLLALRALQGFLLPAIFTALMTYTAALAPAARVRQYMAYYVAATILGGFFGRGLSGAISTLLEWRYSFVLLGIALLANAALLSILGKDTRTQYTRTGLTAFIHVWKNARQRSALVTIFLFFFTFSGLLNTLPFRMVDITPTISEFSISVAYSGYLVGIIIALAAEKISLALGGEEKTLRIIFLGYAGSLLLFLIPHTSVFILFLLVASACFFLLHSLLSGLVNAQTRSDGSIVNGLYVASYYAGGSLGAWLAPLTYRASGWYVLIATLCAVVVCAWLARACSH